MKEIYNPKDIEEPIYTFWEQGDYFSPHMNTNKKNYCIMMPPPNITGSLHLGHAFQQTIMDTLIRYNRMQGKNTLWQTGVDHAGIATQILIENTIFHNTGKTRNDYTKEELIKKIWEWKKKSEQRIDYQMKRLGNSVYWKNKRFTMDNNMSYSVREAFIRLYQNDLIYKAEKLVNWDTKLQTAISDLEISNQSIKSNIWNIRYKLDHSNTLTNNQKQLQFITVSTTRPETMFGDTAIAVHPNDSRYNKFAGQYVITPITNRYIPIILDKHVDMYKGTGCVKITPAHDFHDYTIGKNHNLPMIQIFSLNGTILKKPKLFNIYKSHDLQLQNYNIPESFCNLSILKAREKILSECEKLNLIDSVEPYNLILPYSNRTGAVIEPTLTNQWYIRTTLLAQQAKKLVQLKKIKFIPKQYEKMYFSWMNNIQDWCISRQIHWGHRIPAWYDQNNNNKIYVGHDEQDIRIRYQLPNYIVLHKDNDVLDTWFSSSLWTFSSLGWPKKTKNLNIFHPTNVIISGFDIIFFWIARMIMLSAYFIIDSHGNPQIPFKTVYITGLIRDEFGQKMSKSKGNTIDPLDIIDGISIADLLKKRIQDTLNPKVIKKITQNTIKKFPNGIQPHGTDSLRLTLMALASSGRDIHWDMNRLKGYHNFCNKLWNASKFVLFHTKNKDCGFKNPKKLFSLADRWITAKFHQTIQNFRQTLEIYRFDKATNILHEFIWHQFCDWYIEFAKPQINNSNTLQLLGTRYTLITLLEELLRLAHPIIPFITEKIWQDVKLITKHNGDTIMLQPFPEYKKSMINTEALINLEWIKKIITFTRSIRVDLNITNNTPLQIMFHNISLQQKKCITENHHCLTHIANLQKIHYIADHSNYPKSISVLLNNTEISVPIPNCINKTKIIDRLNKQLTLVNYKIQAIQKTLKNEKFKNKAALHVILKKTQELNHHEQIQKKLTDQYHIIKKF